jgi:GNAT superfamily N-acetyltransferase
MLKLANRQIARRDDEVPTANVVLRPGNLEDAEACGVICHDAFADIAAKHNFAKDFPSAEFAIAALTGILGSAFSVVAEADGRIIGSNFLDERGKIYGVGPITVDPAVQDSGTGRLLMQAVLDRAAERGAAGVRLLQDAFHNRSFVLYTKLGFQMRVTTSVMQGPTPRPETDGPPARPATLADLEECNRLCVAVHGHDRSGELKAAIDQGSALVVTRSGRITGYSSGVRFFGHSVAESNDDLKALIAATPTFLGPGFHVPNDNAELLRWCYANGLRMVKAMTLMTMGLYNEPQGKYLPSVLF